MNRVDELLGRRVSLRALALLRIPVGAIALLHLAPELRDARHGAFYRDAFNQPYASWYPQLDRGAYTALLWIGVLAAVAMTIGLATRVAAVTTFVVVTYHVFASTTNYHNNRAYLVVVLGVLAIAPCGRELSVDALVRRHAVPTVAPAWPLWLLRFEACAVYGASGTSKLLDPNWFNGTVIWGRVQQGRDQLAHSVLPHPVVSLLLNRSFESVAAKFIIATELFIAFGLWSRRTRYVAVWLAVCFHVAIETSASVEVFSYLGIAALLVWAVPSVRDRALVLDLADPAHRRFASFVHAFDWLARFRVVDERHATLHVVDRDGSIRRGRDAAAFVVSRLPLFAWFALPCVVFLRVRYRPDDPVPPAAEPSEVPLMG